MSSNRACIARFGFEVEAVSSRRVAGGRYNMYIRALEK
jgi:hypothetical protein